MKFAQFDKTIIKNNVDYSVKKITEIIEKIGPRESASKQAYMAMELLREDLEKVSDETHYESYEMASRAFQHFTKIISAVTIGAIGAGSVLKFAKSGKLGKISSTLGKTVFPHALVSAATVGSLGVTAAEFLFYKQFTDVFYKKVTGHNLIATRKAAEKTKKRIVINGHIDSAYECRHTYYGKGWGMTPLMAGTIGSLVASAILSSFSVVTELTKKNNALTKFVSDKGYLFHLFTLLNMITLYFFIDFKRVVPGANDNLTGTMAAATALKMLDEAGIRFKNTEVVAMITDGEEAGLRGAKQFAKDHYKDYVQSDVETSVLCVDTLADFDYLNVYNRDMSGTVKHDPKFCKLVMDSAKEAGYDGVKFANVFFGSSDAAAFSQQGISATCLAAMDPAPADYYHNRKDSYDRLVPKTIEAGYDIIMASILNFADEEISEEEKEKDKTN